MSEVKRYQHIGNLCRSTPVLMELYPRATQYVEASDYDALAERYECNTAIMHARTEALSRVTAERDAALAELAEARKEAGAEMFVMLTGELAKVRKELAALKGGREAVGHQYQRQDGSWCSFLDERHYRNTLEDGTWPIRAIYAAPPALASAGVPEGWREFIEDCATTAGGMVNGNRLSAKAKELLSNAQPVPKSCQLGAGCDEAGVCFAAANGQPDRCGMLAAPTLGASDGKEGA